MGGKFGIFRDHGRKFGPLNLSDVDYERLKKLWSEIETNPQKYSRGIYTGFFTQFPQYVKYFTEEKAAAYEDAHRINEKFSIILATLGYLIIDFYKKPRQFDRILEYVARIHQDMYLTIEDFNNFTHAVIQHLKDAIPDIMTEECAKVFADFMDDLTHQLVGKMVKNRAELSSETENRNPIYYPCRWFNQRDKVIYGHDQSYWTERKNKWEVKMERWKTGAGITESSILYNMLNVSNTENDNQIPRKSVSLETDGPHAQGSVMSEILHDKIWTVNRESVFKSGPLRSRSSQILQKEGGQQSTAAAIILAGNEEALMFKSQLSPRERFRNRRVLEDSKNVPSTSNNQEVDLGSVRDEEVQSGVAARQRRRRFPNEQAKDKTDH